MGKGPIGMRVHLDDGSGFDLTEAGTQKRLAVYVVRDASEVPGVARLGIDPLSEEFTAGAAGGLLAGERAQVKGVLTDQSAHRRSRQRLQRRGPVGGRDVAVQAGANLTPGRRALHEALVTTLRRRYAVEGLAAGELKAEKKSGSTCTAHRPALPPLRRRGARGVVRDEGLQYCATCQTGGKPLADRRMSRLLK